MRHDRRIGSLLVVLSLPLTAAGETAAVYEWDGHVKARVLAEAYPDRSLFRDVVGAGALDAESDLRLNLSVDRGRFGLHGDYQAFVLAGDTVDLARNAVLQPGAEFQRFPDDARRLFDLTHVIGESGDSLSLHRLDRLWLGYAGENTVVRIGRQALTWGGGLFFSPLDIVNPFDPAAIDTEYKAGDDMLYAQFLRSSGDDVQFAYVARRELGSGDVRTDEATAALKYHGILGDSEYDLLLARNYGRTTVGLGGNRSIGGAVARADVVVTDGDDWTVEVIANLSYSWVWWDRNVSGAFEYYFNGWGQRNGRYDPLSLSANPELLERLARGETFSLGRNYLAFGVPVEVSPLWQVTPNVFANLDDRSALLQVVAQHSLGDNLTLLGAFNLPIGPDGTEYGGIDTGVPDRYLSRSASLFAQLAWYF